MKAAMVYATAFALVSCQAPEQRDALAEKFVVWQQGVSASLDSVQIDISTPDRALRSRWRLSDLDTRVPDVAIAYPNANQYDSLSVRMLEGDALAEQRRRLKSMRANIRLEYDRQIIEVKQESESRAVVVARVRNVTPIPADVRLSAEQERERRDGEVYRYIFERFADGWKLVQLMHKYSWSDEWRPYFSASAGSEAGYIYTPVQP